jgi:hypothetical protein
MQRALIRRPMLISILKILLAVQVGLAVAEWFR